MRAAERDAEVAAAEPRSAEPLPEESRPPPPAPGAITPAQVLRLQRSAGNAQIAGWLAGRSPPGHAVLARMQFSRFQGPSRLVNWSYDAQETALLALERRVTDAVTDLEDYLGRETHDEVAALRKDLDTVSAATIARPAYETTEAELKRILREADRLSSGMAREHNVRVGHDRPQYSALGAVSGSHLFTLQPGQPLALAPPATLLDVMKTAREIAARSDVRDVGDLRELLDVLGQWVSDALIKLSAAGATRERMASATLIKAQVLDAGRDAQAAFLAKTVAGDQRTAVTSYIRSAAALLSIDDAGLAGVAAATEAKPKLREASDKGYDTGAITLAGAIAHDGFVPHLVVGLPTGGVHVANRVAAALALMSQPRPTVWATRVQGVKATSKQFMEGTGQADVLTGSERQHLERLLPSAAKILIVDDGFVSGDTLVMTKRLYAATFPEAEVRTGVISVSTAQTGSEVFVGKGQAETKIPNPTDYFTSASAIAGRSGHYDYADNSNQAKTLKSDPDMDSDVLLVSADEQLEKVKIAHLLKPRPAEPAKPAADPAEEK